MTDQELQEWIRQQTAQELANTNSQPQDPKANPLYQAPYRGQGLVKDAVTSMSIKAQDPLAFLKGATVNTGGNVLKGIAGLIANVPQAVMPEGVEVPFATRKPTDAGDRFMSLLNSATFGLSGAAEDAYSKSGGNFSEAAKTFAGDVVQKEAFLRAFTGRDEEGKPVTPEALGEASGAALLALLPILKVGGGAIARLGESGLGRRGLTTASEIPKLTPTAGGTRTAPARPGLGLPTTAREVSPAEMPLVTKVFTPEGEPGIASLSQVKAGVKRVQDHPAMQEWVKMATKDQEASGLVHGLVRAVEREDFPPEVFDATAKAMGLDLADFATRTVEEWGHFKKSASTSGKILEQFSRLGSRRSMRTLLEHAKRTTKDPAKLKKLTDLADDLGPMTFYERASSAYKTWLTVARSSAVGQFATTVRNIKSQGLTGIVNAFESSLVDAFNAPSTVRAALQKRGSWGEVFRNTHETFASTTAELVGQGRNLADLLRLTKKGVDPTTRVGKWAKKYRDDVDAILDEIPYERAKLFGGNVLGDVALRGGLRKAFGEGRYADAWANFITAPNRAQEMFYRRMAFGGRLHQNLAKAGYDMDSALNHLRGLGKDNKIDPNLEFALTDAADFTLKSTFSMNPREGTLAGNVMKLYRDVPFMAGIGPYFPRFLINQWQYITEHSPAEIYKLMSPTWKKNYLEGLNAGFKTLEQQRVFAKTVSGMNMFFAANALLDGPEHEGLKYYQIRTGETDKNGNPIIEDLRAYQPFISYAFLADAYRAMEKGRWFPENLTPSEIVDALAGVRNLGEVPMFAIGDLIRANEAKDPETQTRMVEKMIGQAISMPTIPLRTITDLLAAMRGEPVKTKDIKGDGLLGPTVSNIPGLREKLPNSPDPIKGGELESEFTAQRQILGESLRGMNSMEYLLGKVGMQMNDVVASYGDPVAERLVRKHMGTIMSLKNGDGKPLSALLAEDLMGQEMPDSLRRDMLRQFFSEIRASAVDAARAENPSVFLKYDLKQAPEILRDFMTRGEDRVNKEFEPRRK